MFNRNVFYIGALLTLVTFVFHTAFAQEEEFQEQKVRLAVFKVSYDGFSDEEKTTVAHKFYQDLAKDERISIVTEEEVRNKLIPLGIDPSEITSEAGYITAGQVLKVDYVLVGTMDKIGDFVEVTFRTFKMPRGTQKRYPGGKTLDMLVKEEIPNIVNSIYGDMGLEDEPPQTEVAQPTEPTEAEPEAEIIQPEGNKPPWALIAIGSAAGGIAAALLLTSSGGDDVGDEIGNDINNALPRPPFVP